MTLQIVKVKTHVGDTHVMVGCLDTAVEFAAWAQGLGYTVEIVEGRPEAWPYTPAARELNDALVRAYAEALASTPVKC